MAMPTVTLPSGVNAGGPAVAFVSANTRVKSQSGYLGLQFDVVLFGGPMATGMWATAGNHVFVNQVPVVLQNSTGTAVGPGPASAPMSVVLGDTRVRGS
ncbi:hypothetical protein [Nocardia amamiensis]|uniref:hypothetical protein n=1 Tax=Nocardia amamiensis TaxID=404578 RepID=UPI00082FDFD8|nr:hypothetical protein [Nocardia amamiensis]